MSDIVLVAFISAGGACVTGLISIFVLLGVRTVGDKLTRTHELINSRMTEMLELTRLAARADGVAAGEQAQRDRDSVSPEAGGL